MSLEPSDPLHCPACRRPYILVSPKPVANDPRGSHILEYAHADGRRCEEPRKRVLVIDDEDELRELIADALKEKGFNVLLAAYAETGLAAIAAEMPDVVVLDLSLKGMDGWDVLEALGARPSPPPVIVISGLSRETAERQAASRLPAFVRGYLAKPFGMDELARACGRALVGDRNAAD